MPRRSTINWMEIDKEILKGIGTKELMEKFHIAESMLNERRRKLTGIKKARRITKYG